MDEYLLSELKKKSNNTDLIVGLILQDLSLIRDLIYGISSAEATVKFKCAKVLRELSKTKPELIYPYFDFFAKLLNNPNNILSSHYRSCYKDMGINRVRLISICYPLMNFSPLM